MNPGEAATLTNVFNLRTAILGAVTVFEFVPTVWEPGESTVTAVVKGSLRDDDNPLVRMHSRCLYGDVLGSDRCDCGPQLDAAMEAIDSEGSGIVLYLGDHEGRGAGLAVKALVYAMEEERGIDTFAAFAALGLPSDLRRYATAAAALQHLGVLSLRLLTNNPQKCTALTEYGITVQPVALRVGRTANNDAYLHAKQAQGHTLGLV